MLRFGSRKSARRATRAGILAGAVAAALAVGGVSAGSAMAEPLCTGSNIKGEGASLQFVAQTKVWIPGFSGEKNVFEEPGVCFGKGTNPQVTYVGPGSSAGLNGWNFNGTTTTKTELGFIATDDAPTKKQIENAETSAGGAKVLVIPVAQTSIGVVINPPANCTVKSISNKQLENTFRGGVKVWSKFDDAEGPGCAGASVTRIVRSGSGSGTTFQFKNYLNSINSAKLACTNPSSTWAELEPIGTGSVPGAANPNITWPENSVGGCKANELSPVQRATATSGTGLVGKVNEVQGSIGYAALPDIEEIKTGDTATVKVQNNGVGKFANATFGSPLEAANNSANCISARYTVPLGGRSGESGESVDWSAVFGADTAIAKTSGSESAYPLCTLTFDAAFNGYSKKAGFTEGQVQTVKDYLNEYVVRADGQLAVEEGGKFYAPLPTGGAVANDVLKAAQTAAAKIAF